MHITEIIEPIKLLKGSHADTASTGQGCIMNVIAYLNGEPQITDQSPCVCVTVRKPLIWFNDFLRDDERQSLIPYIERAMGSATEDKAEMRRRLGLLVAFANKQRDIAKDAYAANAAYAAYAADAADAAYAANAAYAADAADAAAAAAAYAAYAAAYAAAANAAKKPSQFREQIKAAAFEYFDAVLPRPAHIQGAVLERARSLVAIAA